MAITGIKAFCKQEWQRHQQKGKAFLLPALLALFVLTFTDKAAHLLTVVWVGPLLSTIKEPAIKLDVLCLLSAFALAVYFGRKGFRQVKVAVLLETYILCIAFIYLFYRFHAPAAFTYVRLKTQLLNQFYLADLALAPLLSLVVYYVAQAISFLLQSKKLPSYPVAFIPIRR
jgi:hypothetical protein